MKFTYEWRLPGSGLSKIAPTTSLPKEFVARFEFETDHTVEMSIATSDSAPPAVQEIRIIANPDRGPLDGTEIRRIPIKNWLEFACNQAAMVSSDGGFGPPSTEEEVNQAAADISRISKRRRIDDDFLRRVAAAYSEGGVRRVMETAGGSVSESQAYRWIKAARDAGILDQRKGS